MNKKTLKEKFKSIYGKKFRLLAVQLDGFSHRLVFDSGKNSNIIFHEFSHCMPEGNWSNEAKNFFADIPNYQYQNNAKEIIFVNPEKR